MWEELGISSGTALLILIVLYFVIKWAVKNGIKEAYRDITAEKNDPELSNENSDTRLRAGQVLEIRLDNGETPGAALTPDDALPPSFIRYADEDILIVSKGAPLATLPCGHIHTGTLREQLAALLGQDAASFDYHPVNRLDKGTSGLLCVARHAHAQRLLTALKESIDAATAALRQKEG